MLAVVLASPGTLLERSRPLIFIHTIMGNSFLYQALAGWLAQYHVLAIDDPHFQSPQDHFTSIEQMAECYADLILKEDFVEPYQVGS